MEVFEGDGYWVAKGLCTSLLKAILCLCVTRFWVSGSWTWDLYIDLRLSSCTVGYLICARKFSPAFLIKVAAS